MALHWADLATLLLNAGQPPGRRHWRGQSRLHAACAAPPPGSAQEQPFGAALQQQFAGQPGVDWVRWNAGTRRVVIDGPAVRADAAALIERLAALEAQLDGVAAGEERDHPGDVEPILRSLVEIVAQLAGTGLGYALQSRPGKRRLGIDLAAALRVLDTLPPLRQSLDRRIGSGTAELLLRLADALDYVLLQGVAGPLVGLLEQGLRLRSRLQRRRRWQQLEPLWNGRPEDHPQQGIDPGPRPKPLPDGAIEHYAEKASLLALAAFGWGVVSLQRLEGPAAALLGGLPRPALLGRQAFCLELGRRLEAMGALLLNPAALERLDRIDTVLLDRTLQHSAWRDGLAVAIRRADLRLELAGSDGLAQVRALQRAGHAVMVLAVGPQPMLAAADIGVGLHGGVQAPPWQADLVLAEAPEVLWLLVPACAAARRCASRGVQASLLDAVVGLALALDGLNTLTAAGINQATNLLSLLAMAQGLQLARGLASAAPVPANDGVPWHALEPDDVLRALASSRDGLAATAAPGLPQHPAPEGPHHLGSLLLDELDTPLTPVLGTGAVLSGLVGAPTDACLILAVLGLNALVGAGQRQGVERRLAQLQQRQTARVWVRRGGAVERIRDDGLRRGDVVVLEAGEVVPADCRLIEAAGVQVDEAVLTGESFPVFKDPAPCEAAALAERSSMLYQGTTLVAGQATAVVVAEGDATEARRGLALARATLASGGLEARLASLTDATTPVALLGGGALLLSALLRGRDPRGALAEGVALTVAAVPEGLPLLASLAQGAAAERLARQGVLVRNPRVLETLGRASVLCLDKTGTLTSGRIRLQNLWVEGTLLEPGALPAAGRRVLELALRATPRPEPGRPLAHPTDRALRDGATEAGVDDTDWQVRQTLPFEPVRAFHACTGTDGTGLRLCIKGAPDVVLAASHQPPPGVLEAASQLAAQGLRVLAVAERPWPEGAALEPEAVRDLRFAGLVVLADPIRPTAQAAVAQLSACGIALKLITGDHPETARATAERLGMAGDGTVLTGPEIEQLPDGALAAAALGASVFARVTSLQKLRLVQVLQQAGETVAMGGDGANDAAAIRLAQVGIALGERATEAARRAADLVVTDGSIEAIGRVVLEGRGLWRSTRDAAALLVGGNLGEIGFTVITALVDGPSPLNTRQLLLTNLLTDVAPALTIAARPPQLLDPSLRQRERPDASVGAALEWDIRRRGSVTALAAWLARGLARSWGSTAPDTVGLAALVATQLVQMALADRRDRTTALVALGSYAGLVAVLQTPSLAAGFGSAPLSTTDLLQASLTAALGAAVLEAHAGLGLRA